MPEPRPEASLLFLRDEDLRRDMELLALAQRVLGEDADPRLEQQGLGRAHHRALAVIAARPGLSVGDLLEQLGVTKQSAGRVLRDLLARELVIQRPDTSDRRMKRLSLTARGEAVERTLTDPRRQRLARAYRIAGPAAVQGFRSVLAALARDGK